MPLLVFFIEHPLSQVMGEAYVFDVISVSECAKAAHEMRDMELDVESDQASVKLRNSEWKHQLTSESV